MPRLYSVIADANMVTVKWNDSSTNERHFVVRRRDASGNWVNVKTVPTANGPGSGSYQWIDTVRGLGLQCYMVSAVADLAASTAEKCVVRPDPTVFPIWPTSVPAKALDWYGLQYGPATAIRSLTNRTINQSLRYGERSWGINLVWGSPTNNITVKRRSSTPWPFLTGEPVALHVAGGGYLKYEERTFGINLGWSSAPVYEWYVLGEGVPGTRYGDGKKALWNKTTGDFLVYGERGVGINLRWYEDTLPPPPQPTPTGPNGAKEFRVWNCHTGNRALKMWVQDVTAGTPMTEVTTLQAQYVNGSCPSGQAPWIYTLTTGHVYFFRAMDYSAPGCVNDPVYGSCSRSDTYLRGDSAGPVAQHTIQ